MNWRKGLRNVNVFWPVWVILGIVCVMKGEMSGWVLLLLVLSHVEVKFDPREYRENQIW